MPEFHSSQEMFTLEGCQILRDTGAGLLVRTKEIDELWLPTSQVQKIEHGVEPYTSKVRMTAWIAKKKGLR